MRITNQSWNKKDMIEWSKHTAAHLHGMSCGNLFDLIEQSIEPLISTQMVTCNILNVQQLVK